MAKLKFLKEPKHIVLYSRAMCGWCIDAKEWLAEQGLQFETRNTAEPAARQEAIELSGQTLVPVIEVDGHVLGDFDTGQLEVFLKKLGYLPA
jgi:glutaredoxin 3